MRNTISDPTGRVKARPNESIYEAAFRAVRELRLGDAAETDLLADIILFAAARLGVVWLRARGPKSVAARSDWPGDRLGLRTVGHQVYQLGGVC